MPLQQAAAKSDIMGRLSCNVQLYQAPLSLHSYFSIFIYLYFVNITDSLFWYTAHTYLYNIL
jgi:hypothetical protein